MRWAVAALLLACVTAPAPKAKPPEKPTAAEIEAEQDSARFMLAKLLVDACTDEPTTFERIQIVEFVLKHCNYPPAMCLREGCKAVQTLCRKPKVISAASLSDPRRWTAIR